MKIKSLSQLHTRLERGIEHISLLGCLKTTPARAGNFATKVCYQSLQFSISVYCLQEENGLKDPCYLI